MRKIVGAVLIIGALPVGGAIGYGISEVQRYYQVVGKAHYHIVIDPTFSHFQQQLVEEAASKWVQAVHDPKYLTIQTTVGTCPVDPGMADACIRPTWTTIMCGKQVSVGCTDFGTGMIEVDTAMDDAVVSHILQHEIGHILGMQHQPPGSVMYFEVDWKSPQVSGATQDVTPWDVREYIKLKKPLNKW